jgi:isoquinoline 1-oxidoreductase beta subunit
LIFGTFLRSYFRRRPRRAPFDPNAHLRVGSDGTVTLWVTKLEMGQGVRTLLPMILAEELEADWTRVRIEQASPGPRFKGIELHTSGSDSSSAAYRQLRVAGAAACWWVRESSSQGSTPHRAARSAGRSSTYRPAAARTTARWPAPLRNSQYRPSPR